MIHSLIYTAIGSALGRDPPEEVRIRKRDGQYEVLMMWRIEGWRHSRHLVIDEVRLVACGPSHDQYDMVHTMIADVQCEIDRLNWRNRK